mgnify:CR=1 FL=1
MTTIDLDELRKEIEQERKRLADKEAVLRYLEEKEGKTALSRPVVGNKPTDSGIIQLDQLIPNASRRTLYEDVRDVVLRFGDQEFSVVHVDLALKQQGIEVKATKFPRSRITTVLGKLEKQGIIIRTFQGGGNNPNRYKLGNLHDLLG